MAPPLAVVRSSSASGSELNGYGRPGSSNGGGTPQPQRQPSFGPQTPQRHTSIPRSASPTKPATGPPIVAPPPTAITAPPLVTPISPAVPTAAAAPASALASLPPLPASVKLNPAVTRVTAVPLATSLTTIPPVAPHEVESVKGWMEKDRAYEGVFREMKTRMGSELHEMMGPRSIPWWEKGTLDVNASRFSQGREKFEVRYPYRRKEREGGRKKGARREGLKLPRKLDPEDANRPEELVPIRLEFDIEHHKIRDTFVWDMNACVVSPDHFAQTVVEDYNLSPSHHGVIVKAIQDQLSDYRAHSAHYDGDSWDMTVSDDTLRRGKLEGESAAWWCQWRKRLRSEYVRGKGGKRRKLVKEEPENEHPMTVEEFTIDNKTLHEDMRILIRLDVIVGSMKLDDQFEWDLDNKEASPEDFAQIYTQELGLGGEFRTAIAHSIREQVHAYQKSLFLVGHPMDGTAVQDEDLRNAFLPSLSSGARAMDQVQAFTPLLNYLSDGELERNEKERDKDYNKRRKRNRGGRRGVALPDREPIRTYRTPAIGFPEPDPATLAAAAAAAAPMSRRAAAAAASVTIANLVASENGGPSFTPSSLPALPAPPPLVLKEKTTRGFFKAPTYDPSVLRPRARIPAPIPSTAADISKFPVPLENDPPPAPTSVAVPDSRDSRAPRAVTAKRAKAREREAKEREFADGQQQNMINGVWHCSNCGCPDSIAKGRRKGPLGDKSQCGTCGKYWHRYRKPRPVEYNSDYDFHSTGVRKEADLARRRRGRPSGAVPATPADTSAPQTPRDNEEDPSRHSPTRDVSPVSTVSSTSDRPLAQRIRINRIPSSSPPAPAPPPTAPVADPTPVASPVIVPAAIPRPDTPPAPLSTPAPVENAAPPSVPPANTLLAHVAAPRPPTQPVQVLRILDDCFRWLMHLSGPNGFWTQCKLCNLSGKTTDLML
ncbi:hypothetical protein B0H15DRAFT_771273 [Mycena belliarum]|uniref:SNF5-domain-containing protein n=1 Tax=Mycena belliarum TaxID=1033014 RepID=A0AAD6XSA2_9AGAR|nr:hypothetical protein B0H15DRAFT_771273 [Mycena belliae]